MKLVMPCTTTQAIVVHLVLVVVALTDTWIPTDGYDPLDPNGNITVTFDIHHWTEDGYLARVTIQNYYQFRHVEKPGWSLGWNWRKGEVIWSMAGALATIEGNCSAFKTRIPHCCRTDPVVTDLTPEAPPEKRSDACCRSGVLAASAIDPPNSFSTFDIEVGNLDKPEAFLPSNLTLLAPDVGYTCSPLADVAPTVMVVVGGKREEQVFRTWKSACTYSTFVANKPPACCVSMSTFYNPEVTPCRTCASSCSTSLACSGLGSKPVENVAIRSMVSCTNHMCPVRVHWHLKSNYMDQWRVKLTVSNYDYGYNYSNWNLVVQHPGFSQPALIYSFNSTKLLTVGKMDEAVIFWGLDYVNDDLLQFGRDEPGSVTTEILVRKDRDLFTLQNGWALPRRVYFNGDNCEMPMPDSFPGLPNVASIPSDACYLLLLLLSLALFL